MFATSHAPPAIPPGFHGQKGTPDTPESQNMK